MKLSTAEEILNENHYFTDGSFFANHVKPNVIKSMQEHTELHLRELMRLISEKVRIGIYTKEQELFNHKRVITNDNGSYYEIDKQYILSTVETYIKNLKK